MVQEIRRVQEGATPNILHKSCAWRTALSLVNGGCRLLQTSMASTSRPPSSIAYPSRELMQELDDVKNLLQMTLDETRAWCNEVESRCSVSAEVAREPEPSAQQSVRDSQGQVANDPLTASDSGDEESPNVRFTERPREGLGGGSTSPGNHLDSLHAYVLKFFTRS